MLAQLFSDLHADWRAPKPITVGAGVDVVIVPGDVCEGARNSFVALRRIVPVDIPIVFVMGNHEYYRRFVLDELDEARRAAPDHNVVLLENDTAVVGAVNGVGGVRFIGATGWVDFRLFGDHRMAAAMAAARDGMNDHRRIGWRKRPWGRFRPQEAAAMHAQSRAYIAAELADPRASAMPVVIVTHHAPSFRSVPELWKDDPLTPAFASTIADDLLSGPLDGTDDLRSNPQEATGPTPRVDFWFHGHVHACSDYMINRTRVICNPHGYGDEVQDFDPGLIVKISS
ncbi:metallophosphoesterase [Bradyrhizobium sp. CB82]|uniref:metallophosphoesterase n=1 Tax=Bradyrhizobium sp. CB82 TaxID=3039159 RepID=UPI0024B19B75|nr:metallophosphoesterase [Bradyrhizobium sp. CB82]WFU41451.1 metallophosphoesterase [Bradyrhizobium sp. CB82]